MTVGTEWPGLEDTPEAEQEGRVRAQGQALSRYIWWDGELREAEKQRVHHYAHALHYGTAVFEGIRCYPTARGPALFRLRDHLERFLTSARIYGLKFPWDVDALIAGAIEVTRKNRVRHAYLRPLAFFGHGPIDLRPRRECPVHVFIATRELGTFLGEGALRNGVKTTISSWRRIHHTMLPTMAKVSGHYATGVLAMHEAMDRGCDDAILLNYDGTVASATGENVFFVKDGVLTTNDEASSIVPGITRDTVLRLARELAIPTEIRAFTREDLMRADEVFLTGTAAEVTPVRELDGVELATGKRTFAALLQRTYLRVVSGKSEAHEEWLTPV